MDDRAAWLTPTASLDFHVPLLARTVHELLAGASSDRERAVRLHDHVRDRVRFGWAPDFDAGTASQTLARGVGFCNTKTPLFVAMLRAAGIPARLHFAGITRELLAPLIRPAGRFVDHSYAEVMLDGRWLHVDSYIVDRPLFEAARRRLQASGRMVGYGIHAHGRVDWDGRADNFCQFVNEGSAVGFSDMDFGVFADVPAFYASGRARTPRASLFRQFILRPLLWIGNRRVAALRAGR